MSFSSPLSWYWVVAPLAVAVLAAVLLLRAIFHVARGRLGHGGLHATTGLVLALAALCAGLIVLDTQSYARLTTERPVAEVTVAALHPALQLYRVTVRRLDGTAIVTTCNIQGDEWLMSAAVQKWRPWMNILGLDSTYALDQVANKYYSAARGNGRAITACDLGAPVPGWMPQGLTGWLMARARASQRRFGSAVYMPLTDGAIYRVIMTQSGLNVEGANPIARDAVARRL
ncbi:MAG TPA: hypothetical protein VK515_07575 [Rhizomicrobium sp.]|nr:hypothetical protein [Rhizomicrobium sp.]